MPREKKINKIVLAVDGNCKKKRRREREREKKSLPGAMLTFQKRQSHRGKSRSSGIKTEVRYHVCVCVHGPFFFISFLFFFFFATNVAVELLKRSNCCVTKKNGHLNVAVTERVGWRQKKKKKKKKTLECSLLW